MAPSVPYRGRTGFLDWDAIVSLLLHLEARSSFDPPIGLRWRPRDAGATIERGDLTVEVSPDDARISLDGRERVRLRRSMTRGAWSSVGPRGTSVDVDTGDREIDTRNGVLTISWCLAHEGA